MDEKGYIRKLAAIFSADVQGYSRLMGDNDLATVDALKACRHLFSETIAKYHGRIVNSPGDNLLAEFGSVVDAVQCAIDVQAALKIMNADLTPNRQMKFRIGVNLGDVIKDGDSLYGDGVNIAARLEGLAEAGGVCISGSAFDQVQKKVLAGYEYLGRKKAKNISEPVRAYRVLLDPRQAGTVAYRHKRDDPKHRRRVKIISAAAMVLFVLLAAATVKLALKGRGPIPTIVERHRRSISEASMPGIAVLPFLNMSGDADQEYFADGFTDDLITDLSKLSGLLVISRNTAFAYKGKTVKIETLGRELGVQYVLEGSIRRAGNAVRINAQLIDVNTGGHVWAERYDREMEDIFNLQDEVSEQIVSALALRLTPEEEQRIRKRATANLNAYDVYLRGLDFFARFTRETNRKARTLFQKAVDLDPGFAAAHAKLGWTYFSAWAMGWSKDPGVLDLAMASARESLSADSSLAQGYCLTASVLVWQKKHEEAIRFFKMSLALDPNYAGALDGMGDALNWAGRPAEAIPFIEEAMRLNPRYPAYYLFDLGHAYYLTYKYEPAIKAFTESLKRNPNFFPSRVLLAAIYGEMEQKVFAQKEMDALLKQVPRSALKDQAKRLPYKDPKTLKRVLAAVAKAGF